MNDTSEAAKAEFLRAKQRLATALTSTPDDKKNWSPSETSRTPVQIAAHVALATGLIQGLIEGKPLPPGNFSDLILKARDQDRPYTSADDALALLDQHCDAYVAWLDNVSPEKLNGSVTMPFGEMPMSVAVTLPADHMRGHAAQIEYLQTVHGDLELR